MHLRNVSEFDLFYISFDEPNCEENFCDLVDKAPWAKRIHGVYGSDSAHKAAAKESQTKRFITVDGDNIINEEFFNEQVGFTDQYQFDNYTFSWSGSNNINGLIYGNGGIKCWPKQYVLDMKTHENSEDESTAVEFCWDKDYVQIDKQFSTSIINGSPLQAYRAGFREGVKMCLDRGKKIPLNQFRNQCYWHNYNRLLIWCNIGMDVENGIYSIFGARAGAHMTLLGDWDFTKVRDFHYIKRVFESWETDLKGDIGIYDTVLTIGDELRHKANLEMLEPTIESSKFFKQVYKNPGRLE